MIRDVVTIQEPNGYLNTYYNGDRKPLCMQYDAQTTGHELYCIGHMLQGAIAYYRATGDRTLLVALGIPAPVTAANLISDPPQLIWLRHRQRLKHYLVNERKDRRRSSDS